MKPMLAEDYVEEKLKFPLCVQPKIDGVRGLNMYGRMTGRSLKPFANRFITKWFSHSALMGLDGELAAAEESDPALCRKTTSALSTIQGEPFVLWWLFDYVTADTCKMPYIDRYSLLCSHVQQLAASMPTTVVGQLRIVPNMLVKNMAELRGLDEQFIDYGFEGTIVRDPKGLHKQGRSTVREGGLLRIKHFVEEEAVVLALQEGQTNMNEATINALGYTERSTHQANMAPNGMIGALLCKDAKTGDEIVVSAGSMTHEERRAWFEDPSLIVGKTIKYKSFKHGVKDKPRFPTFQSIRMEADQ
jgi:DNA ligase-1